LDWGLLVWGEGLNNPSFNYGEFAIIKSQAGLNSYKISIKEWVKKTNAIGIASPHSIALTGEGERKTQLDCHYSNEFINRK